MIPRLGSKMGMPIRAKGSKIHFLVSNFGFHQILNEPTDTKTWSSCITLILTLQPNLVTDSGVHSSYDLNCHRHTTYVKLNLILVFLNLLEKVSGTRNKLIQIVFSEQSIPLIGRKLFSNFDMNKKILLFYYYLPVGNSWYLSQRFSIWDEKLWRQEPVINNYQCKIGWLRNFAWLKFSEIDNIGEWSETILKQKRS